MNLPSISWLKKIFLLLLLTALFSCASAPKPDISNTLRTIAILPFGNDSNNIDAPNIVRQHLKKKLKAKFYKVLSLKKVDQILLDELGITLGEQLKEVDFSEIRAKVNADGFVFGHVTYFDQTITGVLNTNRVSARMNLIRASNDKEVWKSNIGIKSDESVGGIGAIASIAGSISDANDDDIKWITIESENTNDSFAAGLLSGLIKSAVASAFDSTLERETISLIDYSTQTLRQGPGY